MFEEILHHILNYCQHKEIDTWKRFTLCGVCPLSDGLAVNTRTLTSLLGENKSSINRMFVELGYKSCLITEQETKILFSRLHFHNPTELRRWTIHKFPAVCVEQSEMKRNHTTVLVLDDILNVVAQDVLMLNILFEEELKLSDVRCLTSDTKMFQLSS
jgi:hypothetical protein